MNETVGPINLYIIHHHACTMKFCENKKENDIQSIANKRASFSWYATAIKVYQLQDGRNHVAGSKGEHRMNEHKHTLDFNCTLYQ